MRLRTAHAYGHALTDDVSDGEATATQKERLQSDAADAVCAAAGTARHTQLVTGLYKCHTDTHHIVAFYRVTR